MIEEKIMEIAIEITNHFFGLGAKISKKDYEWVIEQIKSLNN